MTLRPLAAALALAALASLPGCSRNADDDWTLQVKYGWNAYHHGDLPEAEKCFNQAVTEAEAPGADPRRLAVALTNLAWVEEKQRKAEEAAATAERALTVFQGLDESADVDRCRCLYTLARAYQIQKQTAKAEETFKQALDVAKHEKAFGEKHPVVAQIESEIGAIYDAQGKFDEADAWHAGAMALIKNADAKKEYSRIAACYENVANHYRLKGDFTKAAAQEEKAVKVLTKPLKKSDPQMVHAVHTLAALRAQQGKQADAIKPLQESLEALNRNPDKYKAERSQVLHDLGTLYYERANYKDAKKCLDEALDLRRKVYGDKDLHTASTLRSLANLEKASGEFREAEKHYKEAISIKESVQGQDAPALAADLESLASVCKRLQKYSAAEEDFMRALEIHKKAAGNDRRAVAATMHNLANFYRDWKKKDKYAQAEQLYKESLDIKEKAWGKNSHQVAKVLDSYAQFLKQTGREDEADEVKGRASQIKKAVQKKEQARKG